MSDLYQIRRQLERMEQRLEALERRANLSPHRPVTSSGGRMKEITADDRAALEEMTLKEGAFCRTTGAIKRAYRYLADTLVCYTHFESS